jgi:hypothetical protein
MQFLWMPSNVFGEKLRKERLAVKELHFQAKKKTVFLLPVCPFSKTESKKETMHIYIYLILHCRFIPLSPSTKRSICQLHVYPVFKQM